MVCFGEYLKKNMQHLSCDKTDEKYSKIAVKEILKDLISVDPLKNMTLPAKYQT